LFTTSLLLATCSFVHASKGVAEIMAKDLIEITTTEDEWWECIKIGTHTFTKMDGTEVTETTWDCRWWTLDGPGTPPPNAGWPNPR
jgi:hypothetical protein